MRSNILIQSNASNPLAWARSSISLTLYGRQQNLIRRQRGSKKVTHQSGVFGFYMPVLVCGYNLKIWPRR